VRKELVASVIITLVVAGCGDAGSRRPLDAAAGSPLQILRSPTPFDQVAAGPVRAMVPDRWQPVLAGDESGGEGFFASPRPHGWARMDGSVEGMAATWIDGSMVGMPSDYYYLAANGPVLERLTQSRECRAESRDVIVNHRPAYFRGQGHSPGDYVVRAEGTCTSGEVSTRWAYFVAAPGYGPVRAVGIPSSGLYVVVAVLRDSRGARGMLRTLLRGARFGDAALSDMIAAASGPSPQRS
jgi:hypothetical protein